MTLDEALSAAVVGERVRHTGMQPGSYIDYQFNGWRINFAGGSSSGWRQRDIDEAADWQIVEEPEAIPLDNWGRPIDDTAKALPQWGTPARNKWGQPA
jgi:hypothetical protein